MAVIGVFLALLASMFYSCAVALQASEARDQPGSLALRPSLLLALARRPRWLAGMALDTLGSPLQAAALLFAPLTIVQPMLAFGLVLLLVLGHRTLGQPVRREEYAAVGAIILGVALISIASPGRSDDQAGVLTVTLILGALGAIALVPFGVQRRRPLGNNVIALSAGVAFAWSALATKYFADDLSRHRWLAFLGWLIASGISSIVGVASENSALQSAAAGRVASLVFVPQLVIPVLLAPILTHEDWASSGSRGIVLGGGLLLVCLGAVILTSSESVRRLTTAATEPSEPENDSEPVVTREG
jgi:drug/metabolite transporter (DMT)-like permease